MDTLSFVLRCCLSSLCPRSGNVVCMYRTLGFASACFGIDLCARHSLTSIEVRRRLRSGIGIEWHRAWVLVAVSCIASLLYKYTGLWRGQTSKIPLVVCVLQSFVCVMELH